MKKLSVLFFMVLLLSVLFVNPAFAEDGDAIWGKLAEKAAFVGRGLRSSGYFIAGIGLIFFSFMAIFNKISWKNLAYIMLSCFVLTAMVGLINYFAKADGNADISDKFEGTGADGNVTFEQGVPGAGGTQPKVK